MAKRALLSVYDKTGILELGAGLHDLGWELVSSGGTAKALKDHGLPVITTEEVTGYPAILSHRVATLHPLIHGGILADLSEPEHVLELDQYGIQTFDLVAVNLYPFTTDPSIELIDIGGPTLIRGAAKNYARVGVLVSPEDYPAALAELQDSGELSPTTLLNLAALAFTHIEVYDREIARWLRRKAGGMSIRMLED